MGVGSVKLEQLCIRSNQLTGAYIMHLLLLTPALYITYCWYTLFNTYYWPPHIALLTAEVWITTDPCSLHYFYCRSLNYLLLIPNLYFTYCWILNHFWHLCSALLLTSVPCIIIDLSTLHHLLLSLELLTTDTCAQQYLQIWELLTTDLSLCISYYTLLRSALPITDLCAIWPGHYFAIQCYTTLTDNCVLMLHCP